MTKTPIDWAEWWQAQKSYAVSALRFGIELFFAGIVLIGVLRALAELDRLLWGCQ